MNYYKTNAIYEYIKSQKLDKFRFVSGNAWQLIYGNAQGQPLMLVYVVGAESSVINNQPEANELEGYKLLKRISESSNLPLVYLRFIANIENISTINIYENNLFNQIPLNKLSEYFKSEGLPVTNTSTAKYLNDRTSSAYHNWQRASLGRDLTVSDIDLWKVNDNGSPEIIIELKRSYYNLERWQPFKDDYKNFILISNLCKLSNMEFKIIYNQRIKEPFEDKIDRLKLFSVDFSKTPPVDEEGIINLLELESL